MAARDDFVWERHLPDVKDPLEELKVCIHKGKLTIDIKGQEE